MPSFINQWGTNEQTRSGVLYNVPATSTAIPVLVLVLSWDGSACTDTRGNTYTLYGTYGRIKVWYTLPGTALQAGDYITVTGASGVVYSVWTNVLASAPILQVTSVNATVGGNQSGTVVAIPTLTTTKNYSGVVMAGAFETTPTSGNLSLFSGSYSALVARSGGTAQIGGVGSRGGFGWQARWATNIQDVSDTDHYVLQSSGTVTANLTFTAFEFAATITTTYAAVMVEISDKGEGDDGDDPNDDAPGTGPWCLADRDGAFHIAQATAGGIRYRRTDHYTGAIVKSVLVTATATDSRPRMVRLPYSPQRLVLVFERGGAIYRTESYDDGATWTTPVSVLASCTKPTISIHPNGTLLIAGKTAAHKLQGVTQTPGETAVSATFTMQNDAAADLVFADDVFHIAGEAQGPGRWQLVAQTGGNIVRYQSWDDCRTWKLVT